MRNVRDLVSNLLRDSTQGTKREVPKDYDLDAKPQEAKRQQDTHGAVKTIVVEQPQRDYAVRRQPDAQLVSEHPCEEGMEHAWKWERGVKTCWICGSPAPLDRRDESTSWQSRVYGKK